VSPVARPQGRLLSCALLLAVAASCGDDGGTNPPKTGPGPEIGLPGVNVVTGASVTDTVLAAPGQPLVVEVRGTDGRLVPGAIVRFESELPPDTTRPYEYAMYVCPVRPTRCGIDDEGREDGAYYGTETFAVDTTDADGRAEAALRFGTVTGPTGVVVGVAARGLVDTVAYAVTAGAVGRVEFTPEDTVLFAGASYHPAAAATDRFGNPRPDAVTIVGGSEHVAVGPGGQVTAAAVGRAFVLGRSQSFVDTAWVTIVPWGTIVAFGRYGEASNAIVTVNLDGSDLRVVVPTSGFDGAVPSWAPNGTEILYNEETAGVPRLAVIDPTGPRRFLLESSPEILLSRDGRFTRDGSAVYFYGETAGDEASPGPRGVWRAAADGSGSVLLAQTIGYYSGGQPAPAPDGQRLAYTDAGGIKVLSVASGAVAKLNAAGLTPRWSPTGEWIAYVGVDGPLHVIHPDGTGDRVVSAPGRGYDMWLDWSPDGEWLIARPIVGSDPAGLELVRVSDGETLALPFANQLYQPSWKP
jgi:hypothetical protein